MSALRDGAYTSYWQTTRSYDNVVTYIQMNFEGMKDDIIRMLAGENVDVITTRFQNDLKTARSKNEVLTALIHLGYLSYDADSKTCRIEQMEI